MLAEAVGAVDGTTSSGLERDFGLLTALRACRGEHLPWPAFSSTAVVSLRLPA